MTATIVAPQPDDADDSTPEVLPAVRKDTSYEITIDDQPDKARAAEYVDLTPQPGELLPVIPAHLRTVAGIRKAAARHGRRHWHRTKFHGIRSPRYLTLMLAWALAGIARVAGRLLRWWWVTESHQLRSQAAADGDSREWLRLHGEAKKTRKARGLILAVCLVPAAAAATVLVVLAPWWATAAAAMAAVVALARAGRPADKPIITPSAVTPRFRKLNADVVLRAYYSAGLGDPDKPGQQIQFGSRMARDGDGTHVLVDLPYGKGLKDAVTAKDKIASGLDVTESQVFLRRDPTSYRRHTLWVADRDPLAVPVGRSPLLACKQTDIWRPAPMGLDERGQLVDVLLMWQSMLIGALPRQGKTFAARLVALYCALDPYVKLSVFDAKGSPDWRKFALVADSCAFGLTPTREGLPPEIFLNTLEQVKTDVQDRYHRLSDLPPEVCPEGKLTREIARDPRFRMPVRVLVLDEFQEWFDLGEISKDIAALLVFLLKVAPGAGVSVIGATQKPSGVGTGQVAQQFTSFRDNFAVRFGLRTSSWQVSEMVLGQGAYSEGLDTSTLLPQYKGVGILRGATDASPTVRTYLADGQDAERILTAARAIRERAGTLSGMAVGEGQAPDRDVLADVLAVLDGEPGAHWSALAERLAKHLPGRWADVTADALSAQLRALGVPSVVVTVAGQRSRGCRAADVQAAASQR